MSLQRRVRIRFSILSFLVATLCAAVLLTSVGNQGLLISARGEFVTAAPVDQPLDNPTAELLQSREFAGFVGGRAKFTSLVGHVVEDGITATVAWPLKGAEQGRSPASFGQRLHSLYCVWIV